MSKALRVLHGEFGRALLISLNRSTTLHAHRACQLIFKIDGPEIDVVVRDQRYRLEKDGVILVSALEPRSYEVSTEDAAVTMLTLDIDPAWLKRQDRRFICSMRPKFFSTPCCPIPSSARSLVEGLVDLIAYDTAPSVKELEKLALDLVTNFTDIYSRPNKLSAIETIGGIGCDARIRKVLSIMHSSVGEPIAVEELARIARMSRPHFFHLFKQETQITPMVYSNMIRMESAIQQICETTDSLFEISLRLGFESPGNFTRFFRMHQGVSPSQYRRSVTILSSRQPMSAAPSSGSDRVSEFRRFAAVA